MNAGYVLKKTVSAVQGANAQNWRRGDVARVHPLGMHEGLFVAEMLAGIGFQPPEGIGKHHLAVTFRQKKRAAEFIEKVHQRVVLLVHQGQAGEQVLIPDKSFHRGR